MTKINTVLQKFIVGFIAASLQKQETMFVEYYTHQKEYHTKLMVDFQWKQKKMNRFIVYITSGQLSCLFNIGINSQKKESKHWNYLTKFKCCPLSG